MSVWKWTLEQPNDFFNALSAGVFVTGRTAKSYQEAGVTRNAIAGCAEAR